jgi:hypothetical protein
MISNKFGLNLETVFSYTLHNITQHKHQLNLLSVSVECRFFIVFVVMVSVVPSVALLSVVMPSVVAPILKIHARSCLWLYL